MNYKTILVHLDESKRCRERIDIATRLAHEFDAHLIGLGTMTRFAFPAFALAGAGNIIEDLQQKSLQRQRAHMEELFRQATLAESLRGTEMRHTEADAAEAVALHARYADLVVIGQPDNDDTMTERDFAARAILAAGRPVLVVPYAGTFPAVGKSVLVAWNAGREATRALTDALPLLKKAARVHIISFDAQRGPHGDVPGADIGLYLSRQGIEIEVHIDHSADVDVGNALLSRAADLQSDLIVMGAYGHSRLHELVMGGVTRTLLDSMTTPVLMSH